MRPKEKQVFEMIFRIKNQLECLEQFLIEDEHEKQLALAQYHSVQPLPRKVVDEVFPIKKKRGRPPGKKK